MEVSVIPGVLIHHKLSQKSQVINGKLVEMKQQN